MAVKVTRSLGAVDRFDSRADLFCFDALLQQLGLDTFRIAAYIYFLGLKHQVLIRVETLLLRLLKNLL